MILAVLIALITEQINLETVSAMSNKLRKLCERRTFKEVLSAASSAELNKGFEPDLTQPVHYFAARGDIQAVRELIENYECVPGCQNKHGITPLHCACYCGHLSVVAYLVEKQKCDTNAMDNEGFSPLAYTACCVSQEITLKCPLNVFRSKPCSDHVLIAKLLLERVVIKFCDNPTNITYMLRVIRLPVYCESEYINFKLIMDNVMKHTRGRYSLELKIELIKSLEITIDKSLWGFAKELLCTYSEVVTSKDPGPAPSLSDSLFHKAICEADFDLVEALVLQGVCKPDAHSIVVAMKRNHYELVRYLLNSSHHLLMNCYEKWPSLLSYVFDYHQNDEELIKIVVTTPLPSDAKDDEGNSPLHLACMYSIASTCIGECYSSYQSKLNKKQELPLHIACRNNNFGMLRCVSSQLGTDINTKDSQGNTPLHVLCDLKSLDSSYEGSFDVMLDSFKYLIFEKKCDVNAQNHQQELPLHIILKCHPPDSYYETYHDNLFFNVQKHCKSLSKEDWVQLTMVVVGSDCLDVNVQDSCGSTPLHIACKKCIMGSALYLVHNFKCNLNLADIHGSLPLHYALLSNMPLEVIEAVCNGCTRKHLQNSEGKAPLHIACEKYYCEKSILPLLKFVAHQGSVNLKDSQGQTPLHIACVRGDSETVVYLTSKYYCDVNLRDRHNSLALHCALESKLSLEAIKPLSSKCIYKHKKNCWGKTPLHMACERTYGHIDKKLILEVIGDRKCVNIQDGNGNTALHLACTRGDTKAAIYLIVNLQCDVNIVNKSSCLALHCALRSRMPFEVLKVLCNKCSDKLTQDNLGMTPLHLACTDTHYLGDNKRELLELISDKAGIDFQDHEGNTPLHMACMKRHEDIVTFLISELHCNVDTLNNMDCLALHYAVRSREAINIVKYISSRCTLFHKKDRNGMTPLHYAVNEGGLDIVKYLLNEGRCFPSCYEESLKLYSNLDITFACQNQSDFDVLKAFANEQNVNYERQIYGRGAPIHVACSHGNHLAVKLLIELNCDLLHKDYEGRLPLHLACSTSLKCVELITKTIGSDLINVGDNNNDTPLHFAVNNRHLDIVKFITVNFACDTATPNKNKDLPLHNACKVNNLDIVKFLIKLRSDTVNCQNLHGDTPLHVACERGALEIVKFLVKTCERIPSMTLRNVLGRLPVDHACKHCLEMVKIVSQTCTVEDLCSRDYYVPPRYYNQKVTTLDIACSVGSLDTVKYLVERRACSLSALSNNQSALVYACGLQHFGPTYFLASAELTHPDVVQYLVAQCGYDPGMSFEGQSLCRFGFETKNSKLVKALCVKSVNIVDAEGNYLLHYACLFESVDILQYLVNCGCDQTVVNKDGELAIHIACRTSLQIAKLLIRCDVNSLNADGNTPLHIACKHRKNSIVSYLVKELKCNINIQNGAGDFPLHIVCKESHRDIIELASLVLTSNTDINCQNIYGNTPLHVACYHRNVEMIQFLFKNGSRADIPNTEGKMALHTLVDSREHWCHRNDPQTVKMVFDKYSAAGFTANHDGLTPLELVVKSGDAETIDVLLNNYEIDNRRLSSYLHIACEHGRSQVVRLLIEHDADLTQVNDDGDLPQHSCLKRHCNVDTLEALGRIDVTAQNKDRNSILHMICRGAMPDVLTYVLKLDRNGCNKCFSISNGDGDTPLHLLAARHNIQGHSPEILGLIECDNPNVKDASGNTALHVACQHAFSNLARHLLNIRSCNPNACNDRGELPLHIAVAKLPELVKLLANQESVKMSTIEGNTPLHIACLVSHQKSSEIIQHLLSLNSDPDIVNSDGNTPLHNAVKNSLNVVKLVATPQNVDVQNCGGDTPLHIACKQQLWDIVKYLADKGRCSVNTLNYNLDSVFHILFDEKRYPMSRHDRDTKCVYHLIGQCFMLNTLRSTLERIPRLLINKKNKDGDTILHIASRDSDEATVKFLIESIGCRLDDVNTFSGVTPLHFVCARGFKEVATLPVIRCLDGTVQITNASYLSGTHNLVSGDTPLHAACRSGNVAIVKHILKYHTKALRCCNALKELPVHIACRQGKTMIEVFSSYLRHFNCNAINESGDTPLHIVCRTEPTDTNLVKLLVQKMKCRSDIQNNKGDLPLHIVCRDKQIRVGVFRLLSNALHNDMLWLLNNDGKTALHELLQSPHPRCAPKQFKSLIEVFDNKDLLTLGDVMCAKYVPLACRYQKLSYVKFLCEKYVSSVEPPHSILCEACQNEIKNVLEYILAKYKERFNFDDPNANGDLPVHLALKTKVCVNSTVFLIKSTKNINYTNLLGNTPLHELYYGGRTFGASQGCILMALLKLGNLNLSVQNHKGETPLHCMCRAHRFDDLKLLISEADVDANIQDENGITILHIVCQRNEVKAAEILLTSKNVSVNPSIKDNQGQSPITLTTDAELIRLLTKHGADTEPLYDMHRSFFRNFSCENPPPTPVNLLVTGNPCVGKTTLIQSMQSEYSEETIVEQFDHTAGVVPTKFQSKLYGEVTFYDFAGQPEFYASHDAVMHDMIKNLPPIALILVNLTHSKKYCLDQIRYWINFLANRCTHLNDKAHVIVIGSHADILERQGICPAAKISELLPSVVLLIKDKVFLKAFMHINCTKSQSKEMSDLQMMLKQSTSDLREKGVMHFNSHCFYVFLLQMFERNEFVTIGRVQSTLRYMSKDTKTGPFSVIPSDSTTIVLLCQDLDKRGHIMFIEHPITVDMCWLILDRTSLFNKLLGMLFAPISFPEHCPLSYSTGVVPLSRLETHFCAKENYPSSLILTFLSRMEYCREVTDIQVLQLIVEKEKFSEEESYYFFPALVSIERPKDKWNKDTDCEVSYKCGWLIQCTADGDLFSSHFIQAILLRLTFSFAPKKTSYDSKDIETYEDHNEVTNSALTIKRLCSVWKNGVYWQEDSGVTAIVDVINQRTLVLLMRCLSSCEMKLVERRSQLISMVLRAKDELCSNAEVREYFIHPKHVQHPVTNLGNIQKFLYSYPRVKASIARRQICVVNEHDESVKLEDLLYYEPYSDITLCAQKSKLAHDTESKEHFSIFRGRHPPRGKSTMFLFFFQGTYTLSRKIVRNRAVSSYRIV